ncbi:MAG: adenylyl-sulfate kinase [Inquilinaceae bacterium]
MNATAHPPAGHTALPLLQMVVVGHVDHGKSTLIGRLLYDTDSLPDGKAEEIRTVSAKRGMATEWSFVLDAFQAERDQAITIDTTQIWLKTDRRDVVIIDAPGHREFLKNMVSGAASADAAVLVVDVVEGVREQTRRHAYLLHLLGLRQVAVVVNKMDAVGFAEERFESVRAEVETYLADIGLAPVAVIPISAREGDNLASRSARTGWYGGDTLLDLLDRFEARTAPRRQPLRFPVQGVYKFDHRRIIAGRIESGVLRVGDTLLFSPSNKTARVASIESWGPGARPTEAAAGQSVGITLDEQIFVERGDIASHEESPPQLTNVFRGTVFWLDRRRLEVGRTLKIKLATGAANVSVQAIERVIDTQTLAGSAEPVVERNAVAEVVLRAQRMLALDEHAESATTGRFVMVDGYATVGAGIISMEGYPDRRRSGTVVSTNLTEVDHLLSPAARSWRNGHRGAVIWLTGLSGSGKSTLAMRVEQRLFNKGFQTYVLDGDNVRRGLNADLGFAPNDRAENIRRVGEVAALFADAGLIAITAFISPYRADRRRAREAAGDAFHEIHVRADVEACEKRDPKGLYKKARAGQIANFTGISAPYEAPERAELVVDTENQTVEQSVDSIIDYIERTITISAAETGT